MLDVVCLSLPYPIAMNPIQHGYLVSKNLFLHTDRIQRIKAAARSRCVIHVSQVGNWEQMVGCCEWSGSAYICKNMHVCAYSACTLSHKKPLYLANNLPKHVLVNALQCVKQLHACAFSRKSKHLWACDISFWFHPPTFPKVVRNLKVPELQHCVEKQRKTTHTLNSEQRMKNYSQHHRIGLSSYDISKATGVLPHKPLCVSTFPVINGRGEVVSPRIWHLA